MLGLVIFPMLFFMIGFLFKVFRPYYKPAEFVFFNMMAAMVALVVANGATLFMTIPFFVQMALLTCGNLFSICICWIIDAKYLWMV